MKTTKKPATDMTIAELTAEVTAFPSWPAFAAAMDGGYVPTLHPLESEKRSKAGRHFNSMVVELADRLERLGWRVWRGH